MMSRKYSTASSSSRKQQSGGSTGEIPRRYMRRTTMWACREKGWFLILMKGKKPAQKHWRYKDPTEDECLGWVYKHFGRHNIGVDCGRSGLVVLDCDSEAARKALGRLPKTMTVKTRRGYHFYFQQPDPPIGNGTGSLPEGVDVRGVGGLVALPGSVYDDDVTAQRSFIVKGKVFDKTVPLVEDGNVIPEVARLPKRILKLIQTPKRGSKVGTDSPFPPELNQKDPYRVAKYVRATYDSVITELSTARPGTRNTLLNKGAFRLGQFVKLGHLDEDAVSTQLMNAAEACGLEADDQNCESVIHRALTAGMESTK